MTSASEAAQEDINTATMSALRAYIDISERSVSASKKLAEAVDAATKEIERLREKESDIAKLPAIQKKLQAEVQNAERQYS